MEKLTPEQIENWRRTLAMQFGTYAHIMPEDVIEKIRASMQEEADKLGEEDAIPTTTEA